MKNQQYLCVTMTTKPTDDIPTALLACINHLGLLLNIVRETFGHESE